MRKTLIVFIFSLLIVSSLFAIGGDTFSLAVQIMALPYNDTGDTSTLTNTIANASNDAFYLINSVVALTNVDIDLTGSSFDTYLWLYAADQTTVIASNDDYSGLQSAIMDQTLAANTDYYIVVEGYSSNNGSYILNVTSDYSGGWDPNAPGPISNASPSAGAQNIPVVTTLSWNFGTNTETYDLFFDTMNPPATQVVNGGTAGTIGNYTPPRLQEATTYYWKVVSHNSISTYTSTTILNFQTTLGSSIVTIGSGTLVDTHLPIEPYYGYSYSQTIYLQSEINMPNRQIEKVYYHYNMGASLSNNNEWILYMGHTTNTSFATTNDWLPISQFTEVYNGPLPNIPPDGWIEFVLDTPFLYNNTDNLVLAVEENQTAYGSSSDDFYGSTVTGARSIYYYSDSTNPDPTAPPVAAQVLTTIPNTRFAFSSSMYPDNIDFGIVTVNTDSFTEDIVLHNNSDVDITIQQVPTISGDNIDQFIVTDNNTYPVTISQDNEIVISVLFHPTSTGHKTAILTIIDDQTEDVRSTHDIAIHGYSQIADTNNSSATATEITLDLTAFETIIFPENDIDWYVFWQTGPAQIDVHTERMYGSTVDLAAFLYGPYNDIGEDVDEYSSFAFDDDSWTDNVSPHLIADVTDSGFYYLRIAKSDNSPARSESNNRIERWATSDYGLWVSTDNHTPPSGFDPPSGLDCNITFQGIFLSWELPVPETRTLTGYNVYRDDIVVNPTPVTTLFYLDPVDGLVENQTYEYKVTALYSGPAGESVACDSVMVMFDAVDPPIISESFETYDDFVTSFGDWINLDGDNAATYGFNNGIDFPGENSHLAYIVFNPTTTTPPLQFATAYSGAKYAACFAAANGSNDDWLITPQIQLTDNEAYVSLIARAYTTQFGMEELEIAVSNGSSDPDDFT
ncbi:MAG: choice-of-anchor J domain-containing protein, partial [Candidatus Cloacimonetes bacterium]|nr:choice-of-anchor J domain-containing protein [Candidatus Cloacimonadota bacterium]